MTEFVIRDEVTGISIGVVRENGWNTVNWSSGSWSLFGFGSGGSGQAAQTVHQNRDIYTQVFRNITSEWLEIVWVNPDTGATEQIISTSGHRFLKPDGGYDRIIDMVDRSVFVDAVTDNHDEADNSFGGTHPFSEEVERPIGVGLGEQIVSDARVALGTADIVLQGGTVVTAYVRSIQYCKGASRRLLLAATASNCFSNAGGKNDIRINLKSLCRWA